MARVNKRIRRQAFHGWWKWAPLVALVFSFLFFDCWLSTERRLQDYELVELRADIDEAQKEIETYVAESAELEQLDRLESKAAQLGLRLPEPGQIERIYYDPATGAVVDFAYPFSMARLAKTPTVPPVPAEGGEETSVFYGKGLPEPIELEVWD